MRQKSARHTKRSPRLMRIKIVKIPALKWKTLIIQKVHYRLFYFEYKHNKFPNENEMQKLYNDVEAEVGHILV